METKNLPTTDYRKSIHPFVYSVLCSEFVLYFPTFFRLDLFSICLSTALGFYLKTECVCKNVYLLASFSDFRPTYYCDVLPN